MARYVAANAPYPRSSEYIATPGYMGAVDMTDGQKKMLYWGGVAAIGFLAWKKLKKKKKK